jgi:hypothetical protein
MIFRFLDLWPKSVSPILPKGEQMKNLTKSLFSFLLLTLGIAAAFMLFLPAMAFPDSDSAFAGYEIVFGTEFANLGGFVTGQIVWNILGIIAYLLPLAACLVAVFVKKGTIVSILLFTAGAALLLLMPEYTVATVTILDSTSEIDVAWTVSYGLSIAALCSLLGVFATLFHTVYTAKKA